MAENLYERLGGTEGITAIANDLVELHVANPRIAPRYADRAGGYTRIIRLSQHRIGDGGDLCVLQLVGQEEKGPQVSGQYSRRREKANRRMEVSARLRKQAKAGGDDGWLGGHARTSGLYPMVVRWRSRS